MSSCLPIGQKDSSTNSEENGSKQEDITYLGVDPVGRLYILKKDEGSFKIDVGPLCVVSLKGLVKVIPLTNDGRLRHIWDRSLYKKLNEIL